MHNLGDIIRQVRKKQRLTQRMLSTGICSQSVLSRIENNEEIPNVVVFMRLCERLGISASHVMLQDQRVVFQNYQIMNDLRDLFYKKQYKELYESLKDESTKRHLYLDSDWQMYYYWYGSCLYYIEGDFQEALRFLKIGLAYTYDRNQQHVTTDMEIQLISCIGRVYFDLDNREEGLAHLHLSIDYFHDIPHERIRFDLTKIFYNIASVYLEIKDFEKASRYATEGIGWAAKTNSIYYLQDLFHIQSQIAHHRSNQPEAQKFENFALTLQQITRDMLTQTGNGLEQS